MSKFMSAEEAVKLIKDGDSIAVSGNGGGIMEPDALFEALEKRFLEEGSPQSLTLTHSAGIGDKDKGGISRFAHEGGSWEVIGAGRRRCSRWPMIIRLRHITCLRES